MAAAEVTNKPPSMSQVQQDDGIPLVDPTILKDKRVMLVRDLDVEPVLACLKPFLVEHFSTVNAINAETNSGTKTGMLIDFLQQFSVKEYDKFNTFLKIVGGTQPDLFRKLVGRAPTETEADFCVQNYADRLKECIKGQGHSIDSPLDEKIQLDSEHVQLAIVGDKPDSETFDDLPHRYQAHLSKVQDIEDNVPAVKVLDVADNEEKPKRVSLYGRAGTGKTTTFQWLAREWSFNRWGTQFMILFLLQMRMLSVSDHHMTAIELLTLAGLYQVTEAGIVMPLASWLRNRVGRALIFIDGLDEVAGFATRLRNCPIISDLNQKAHPVDLCLNILRGNLLAGVTVISSSRPFAGLDVLQFDKKFEILGLTESRVKEFVERKHPSKAADIMSVLTTSPLLMSVCSITFYCALISRLLADGVIFQHEHLQTYTRLMAFLIVQCVERKLPEWSFLIQVGTYFKKLAHMGYIGMFERQLKGEMSKLVFNDRDICQARLTPQDLKSIQEAGLLHFQKIKVGLRSSVTAEFFHFSVQEMLASAYFLSHCSLSDNIFSQLFSGGQFNSALLYLFGLQCDTGSDWIKDIRNSVNSSGEGLSPTAEHQMNDFILGLCEQGSNNEAFTSQLQVCQLLHEGQMEDTAKTVVKYIVPNGKLKIENTQMTLIDIMAVWFVCKYAEAITEITLTNCGLTNTLLGFLGSSLLRDNAEKLRALKLRENKIGFHGAKAITEWLSENHNLHTLDLYENNIGKDGAKAIAAVLQNNSTLQALNVRGNNIGDNGVTAIAAALQNNTTLHTLHVGRNIIGENGATDIAAALQNNSNLQTLHVGGNNIGDNGATAIVAALQNNMTLQTLDVHGNNIGVDGAKAIAAALQGNNKLQTLKVWSNKIGESGATAIAAALENNKSLLTLDVGLNSIGDNGTSTIAAALQGNNKLQTLRVWSNKIGECAATAIAAALQNNKSLLTLDIGNNNIGENGVTAIAASLHHNNTLKTLHVGSNNIGDKGATALAAALQNNTTLQMLNVSENRISDAAVKVVKSLEHRGLTIHIGSSLVN